jgi:hypothetical protein
MSKEITGEAITQFLDGRDDFDLELFALRAMTERGWGAHHGGAYTDPITEKPRQYDVWGLAEFAMHCEMQLAVECKSLTPEFPLVVSRVPRVPADAQHDLIKTWLRPNIGDSASIVENSEGPHPQLYSAGAMVGKATNQVRWHESGKKLISSDADTYDKWSQGLAAATQLVRSAVNQPGPADGQPRYTFIMPVLVVSDDALWVVDYDEHGYRKVPARADKVELYVDRHEDLPTTSGKRARYHLSHLHIYTRKGFVQALGELGTPSSRVLDRIYGWAIKKHAAGSR